MYAMHTMFDRAKKQPLHLNMGHLIEPPWKVLRAFSQQHSTVCQRQFPPNKQTNPKTKRIISNKNAMRLPYRRKACAKWKCRTYIYRIWCWTFSPLSRVRRQAALKRRPNQFWLVVYVVTKESQMAPKWAPKCLFICAPNRARTYTIGPYPPAIRAIPIVCFCHHFVVTHWLCCRVHSFYSHSQSAAACAHCRLCGSKTKSKNTGNKHNWRLVACISLFGRAPFPVAY